MAVLGRDITTGEVLYLPPDNLHTYILGNTGTGKTSLERVLIADAIIMGYGVCVIDPHGERKGSLVDQVLSDIPDERIQDTILFDINNPRLIPGLKPFYCRDKRDEVAVQDTISTALNMFEKVYNVDRNTMARIIAYIESLIYLFIYDESLTLLDIPNLLNPDPKYDKKRTAACMQLPPSPGFNFTRDFWTEEYSRRAKRGYNQDSEIFGTLMKFRELSSHLLWPMFCQNKNTLDLRDIMQDKKILLVKLNGNWEDITSLIGSYLIGQIKDAAFHRSLADPPFYLYVDEFQRMASRDFLTLFSEARGGNVHVCIDHQVSSQLDNEMKETIRQASTFICFQVTDITAASVAEMFDTTPPLVPERYSYSYMDSIYWQRSHDRMVYASRRPLEYIEYWENEQAEQEFQRLGNHLYDLRRQLCDYYSRYTPSYGEIDNILHKYPWRQKEIETFQEAYLLDVPAIMDHVRLCNGWGYDWRSAYTWIVLVYCCMKTAIPLVPETVKSRIVRLVTREMAIKKRLYYLWDTYHKREIKKETAVALPIDTPAMVPAYGSDEVAQRTANQLKQLFKYQARIRLVSGEYTITTIAPHTVVDITKRIEKIYQHNIRDGYLRLRSDVEQELQSQPSVHVPLINHTPVPAIPLVNGQ